MNSVHICENNCKYDECINLDLMVSFILHVAIAQIRQVNLILCSSLLAALPYEQTQLLSRENTFNIIIKISLSKHPWKLYIYNQNLTAHT